MTTRKIKQINAPVKFTKVVFVCLFKVISVNPPFKTESAYTFTNKTTQFSVETSNQHSCVFWHLSNQKNIYQRQSSTLKHAVVNNNKF